LLTRTTQPILSPQSAIFRPVDVSSGAGGAVVVQAGSKPVRAREAVIVRPSHASRLAVWRKPPLGDQPQQSMSGSNARRGSRRVVAALRPKRVLFRGRLRHLSFGLPPPV